MVPVSAVDATALKWNTANSGHPFSHLLLVSDGARKGAPANTLGRLSANDVSLPGSAGQTVSGYGGGLSPARTAHTAACVLSDTPSFSMTRWTTFFTVPTL